MLNNLKRGSRIPPTEPSASVGFLLQFYEIEYNGIKTIPIIELAKIKYPGINFKLIDMDGELVCVGVLDNFNVIIFSLHTR